MTRSFTKNYPIEPKYTEDMRYIRTFMMLKPDCWERGLQWQMLNDIQGSFEILGLRMDLLSKAECATLYCDHVRKDFYPRLEAFITSGPCLLMFVRAEWIHVREFVLKMRDDLGVTEADLPRNLIHCSDSANSAGHEVGHVFPGFSNAY